jgi:hypothetical protein
VWPECWISVTKCLENFIAQPLKLVRRFIGLEKESRAVRVIALAMTQNAGSGHLVIFCPQPRQCHFHGLHLRLQVHAFELVPRWYAVDDVSVARFPDASAKRLNGVGNRLFEIAQIALLMDGSVESWAIKHLRI